MGGPERACGADQQDVNIAKVGMLSERDTAYSCKMTKTSTAAIIPGWLEVICSTPYWTSTCKCEADTDKEMLCMWENVWERVALPQPTHDDSQNGRCWRVLSDES